MKGVPRVSTLRKKQKASDQVTISLCSGFSLPMWWAIFPRWLFPPTKDPRKHSKTWSGLRPAPFFISPYHHVPSSHFPIFKCEARPVIFDGVSLEETRTLETEKVNAIYRVSCNAGVREAEVLEKRSYPLVKLMKAVRESL
jgi:hypothetical protein